MITLYHFGPAFGLPDASPFCIKAETLLKFSGLEYKSNHGGFKKAPKGKQPFIDDDGTTIADSTFIRLHIESKHGHDFDTGLDARDKGIAWAVEKMFEDHLYWVIIADRWCNDQNFDRGPRMFFEQAPALIRPMIISMIRKKVSKATKAHGLGRHSTAEIHQLAERGIDSVAAIMGDNKFLMGDEICGADATAFGFLAGLACEHFETPTIAMVKKHANLVAYLDRMFGEWYPDLKR